MTKILHSKPSVFPPTWQWLVDQAIPELVKSRYSPKENWKEKPFSQQDALFFFKGIRNLSDLFTDERPSVMPAYFQQARFRSAYLLYFLPLQAAKFITLFNMHSGALEAAMRHGRKNNALVCADLGAGPGTASLALLLWLMQKYGKDLPKIEIHLCDLNASILSDGKELIQKLAGHFSDFANKVTVHTHVGPWKNTVSLLPAEVSLIFMGNVLNETPTRTHECKHEFITNSMRCIFEKSYGGGVLITDPASRNSAQLLSKTRDLLIDGGVILDKPFSIWGPCLHASSCPLATGRDWCHFSVPVNIPGKWFKIFSRQLGSERQWAKFSYLWLTGQGSAAPKPASALKRVVSDPFKCDSKNSVVLLCAPEAPIRRRISNRSKVWRGDIIA